MKVHELITELQKYDPNLDVLCLADGEYWWGNSYFNNTTNLVS